MAIALNEIVPWGRSRKEYELMFSLTAEDLSRGVLDCGGGPASFVAESSASGMRGISVDPVYAHSGAEIQARFESAVQPMLAQVRATPQDWTWGFHRDPDALCEYRRAVLKRFLADYEEGSRAGRYVVGELSSLPFQTASFGLAVCSHLLFLYSDVLSETFHVRAVAELCRVAKEVRIFPLLALSRNPSPHLAPVQSAIRSQGWVSEVVRVDYELQRGGNQMLRVYRP